MCIKCRAGEEPRVFVEDDWSARRRIVMLWLLDQLRAHQRVFVGPAGLRALSRASRGQFSTHEIDLAIDIACLLDRSVVVDDSNFAELTHQ